MAHRRCCLACLISWVIQGADECHWLVLIAEARFTHLERFESQVHCWHFNAIHQTVSEQHSKSTPSAISPRYRLQSETRWRHCSHFTLTACRPKSHFCQEDQVITALCDQVAHVVSLVSAWLWIKRHYLKTLGFVLNAWTGVYKNQVQRIALMGTVIFSVKMRTCL